MAETFTHYRRMPPEPWGRRLLRAREDLAGLNLDQAAELVGNWMLTTASTISRLEDCSEVPVGPRAASRRQLAYILCVCYQVDPTDFGLSPDDVPPGIKERLAIRASRGPVTRRETDGSSDIAWPDKVAA